jgi:hypothetical protein
MATPLVLLQLSWDHRGAPFKMLLQLIDEIDVQLKLPISQPIQKRRTTAPSNDNSRLEGSLEIGVGLLKGTFWAILDTFL